MDKDAKKRPLYIAKILYERTDEDTCLSTNDLAQILKDEYGIEAYRVTIAEDIKILQDFGMDIQVTRAKTNLYNLVSREFDYAELKLLMDAIASAKFITKKKSADLVAKVAKFAGNNKAAAMNRNVSVERRIKSDNELIYHIIDAINEAINAGKKISFQYFEYNVKKERKMRYDGYWYKFNPYKLVWNGDYYYVVGLYEKYNKIMSYRVDRIASVPKIMDDDVIPLQKGFDIDQHLNTMFRMFSTEREKVELVCRNDCMDAIIDRFGEDVTTFAYDMDNFLAEVEIAINNIFFSWVFGFGGKVWIKGPVDVKEKYAEMIREACDRINNCTDK